MTINRCPEVTSGKDRGQDIVVKSKTNGARCYGEEQEQDVMVKIKDGKKAELVERPGGCCGGDCADVILHVLVIDDGPVWLLDSVKVAAFLGRLPTPTMR